MRFFALALLLVPAFGQESVQRIEVSTPGQLRAAAILDGETRKLTLGTTTEFNVRMAQREYDRAMQADKVQMVAQSIERTGNLFRLSGGVEIHIGEMIVRADDADYHLSTGAFEPRGNVRVVRAGQ